MKTAQDWQQELDEARRDAEVWRSAAVAEEKLRALVSATREWAQMFDDIDTDTDTDTDYAWHYAERALRSAIAAAKDDTPP